MLLPLRVLIPDGERAFEVLLFECCEKLAHGMALGMVAEVISEPDQNECGKDCDDDQFPAAAFGCLVVLLRIHQGHSVLSIIESEGIEKVPRQHVLVPGFNPHHYQKALSIQLETLRSKGPNWLSADCSKRALEQRHGDRKSNNREERQIKHVRPDRDHSGFLQ